jgi:DNA-binding MarR family transcriptional regulator
MRQGSSQPPPSLAALLRRAQRTYANAIRAALAETGHDDIPANGHYLIGGLARGDGVPISRLVEALGITKQGAGQLVDTLVLRGYLARRTDAADRRKLIVTLTARGRAAAQAQAAACRAVDRALEAAVGPAALETTRRTLAALALQGQDLTGESSHER